MHFSCWQDSKTSQLQLLWKLASPSPSFLLLRRWFKKSLHVHPCSGQHLRVCSKYFLVQWCFSELEQWNQAFVCSKTLFLRGDHGFNQSLPMKYWKKVGVRDRIACPKLFFFGTCPCDVFLPRAEAACYEYEGGFWSLVAHMPIGKCTKALWSPDLIKMVVFVSREAKRQKFALLAVCWA